MEKTMENLTEYFSGILPGICRFGLRVILCIVLFWIGRRLIRWIVDTVRRMMERTKVQAGAVTFTVSVVKISLYCVLVLIIALQMGVEESSVAALLASAGVAVGLAVQGGLSNLAGGFLILMFQPFQVGDYVIAQGQEGTVEKIEILYTTLGTVDNRRVIVPNGVLANDVIVNVTAAEKRKLEIKVGISYEDSVSEAKAILMRLMETEEEILTEEEHQVFVAELAESSVIMGIRCWVRTDQYLTTLWRMNEKIKEAFETGGIHIPYPQMDIHMK